MHTFQIPLFIWLNAMFLVGAAAYIWGKLSGEAEHERESRRQPALAGTPANPLGSI